MRRRNKVIRILALPVAVLLMAPIKVGEGAAWVFDQYVKWLQVHFPL